MTGERILYLECRSGISGDMTVASLLDLGADENKLRAALASLPLTGYRIEVSRVKKSGLDACDFAVILDEAHENHDHDMAYLHGNVQLHDHEAHHHQEAHHDHAAHVHRGLPEIRQIIRAGTLTAGARTLALRIFDILADAEAKAHGVSRDEVHFHEVGAVDSIIDIVAAAVCLDDLAPDRIIMSPLAEGTGTVRCQHGILPIPVPAVSNIAKAYGLPMEQTSVQGELVTPTGAAIAAAVMQMHTTGESDGMHFCLPDTYRIEEIGIGAGKREYATAGILRAMWIRPPALSDKETDTIVKLEANIDDASGEQLGYCMECLMQAGARDVSFLPLYMKKNRPAYEIHVICEASDVPRMERILFRETTTIGIRRTRMERTVMAREERSVETVYGSAKVKICSYEDIRKIYPEYESVAALCRQTEQDFREVYQAIIDAAR